MGRPQIFSLLALRSDALVVWQQYERDVPLEPEYSFNELFGRCCQRFDSPDAWSLEIFRDELVGDLVQGLPHPSLNYDRWLLELDPKEHNRRQLFGEVTQDQLPPPPPEKEESVQEESSAGIPPSSLPVPIVLDSAQGEQVRLSHQYETQAGVAACHHDKSAVGHTNREEYQEEQIDFFGKVPAAGVSPIQTQPDWGNSPQAKNPLSFAMTGLEPVSSGLSLP